MALPHIGAAKIGAWIFGSAIAFSAAIVADAKQGMNPLIIVALIMSGSSLLVAIITGGVSIYLQKQTGKKIDGMLEAKDKREEQFTVTKEKLSHAEGWKEGSQSERREARPGERPTP